MNEPFERLQRARAKAGYSQATDAARAFGWNENTYRSHENGERGLKPAVAEKYARAFRVSAAWLLTGEQGDVVRTVPLLGKVSAGAVMEIMSEAQGPFEEVEVFSGDHEATAAAEIKGDCMGPLLDGWLVFWNSGRTISPKDLVGKICVIGLDDGRVMLKKLTKGSIPGMFTLYSQFDPPIYDALVKWASPVTSMRPR